MARAEIIAALALFVSIAAFSLAAFNAVRDRAKLVVKSKAWPGSEYGAAGLRVTIVNAGRRPIVLRMFIAVTGPNSWYGEYLGDQKSGLRLGEREHHEITWHKHDMLCGPEDDELAVDLQVEDSLGNRYPVLGAKENLEALLAS
jgi:hypothetical protein